jgi:tetratricopeptide (TPR) repeat protein
MLTVDMQLFIRCRKTQIAIEYANWAHRAYPEMSIFWIHANNPKRFLQSLLRIAQECDISGHDDPKKDKGVLVKNWLQRKDCPSWLLILDNADDYEMFFSPLEAKNDSLHSNSLGGDGRLGGYIPECAHGSILVTTRNKQAAVKLTRNYGLIEVEKMTQTEASQLVINKLENDGLDRDQVALLTSRLENLPLAIAQAASFMRENTMSVEGYLQQLASSDDHLTELLIQPFEEIGRDSEIPNAVISTWILSFEQIRKQCSLASDMLSLMSYFDRQRIPKAFLKHKKNQNNDSGVRQQIGASADLEQEKAVGVLKAFSFIVTSTDGKTLNMHRLVQLAMRKWLIVEKLEKVWAEKALLILSDLYPYGSHENRGICNEYLPHAYAVLGYKLPFSANTAVARASLLYCISGLRFQQGQWNNTEELLIEVKDLQKKGLGAEHPSTLVSMTDLAKTYRNQGRWKDAEELGVLVMEKQKIVLGAEHPDTLISMSNVALAYSSQGRWKEAEELEVQVMETRKRVLGAEHPDTLVSIANLAMTYSSQGRWKEGEELGVQVMETRKRVLGAEHPDTLVSIANLAMTYSSQGRWKEGEELEVQVMETRKRALGAEHPDTLVSIANLASTYSRQGRWKEGEELGLQVMETRKRVLGAEHPDTLISISNLASWYSSQGRWKEAEGLEVQVTETRKRVLGAEHPETLRSIANLAMTHGFQGRWKEAEELGVQVMETRKRVLGAEHPDTLVSIANLAMTYSSQGRWKEAKELEVQVMETRKRVLRAEHPDTLRSIANLAMTHGFQGRWKEAEELGVQVIETRKRVLGAEHPDTLISMGNMAWTYRKQGRYEEAKELEMQVREAKKRVL